MNEYQDKELNNEKRRNNNNLIKSLMYIVGIIVVAIVYILLPPYDSKRAEKSYTKLVDKLCGSAIKYTEIKELEKTMQGETVYVKIENMQKEYLIDYKDVKDPRNIYEKSEIPSSSYIRLSKISDGSMYCEGLINTLDDEKPPILSLKGSEEVIIAKGTNFVDPGAKSTDDIDGDISSRVERSGNVDINTPGEYEITYSSLDMAGNLTSLKREVIVQEYDNLKETTAKLIDRIEPRIEIKGSNPYCLELGYNYKEPGVTSKDNVDGNISEKIVVENKINNKISKSYRVTYTVSDTAGNKTSAYRSVIVKETCTPLKKEKADEESMPIDEEVLLPVEETIKINAKPTISLLGDTSITIKVGESYSDIGATAYDLEDGDLTHKIKIDSTKLNINKGGVYIISYEVTDSGELSGKVERLVNVIDQSVASNVATFNESPQNLKIKLGYVQTIEKITATDTNDNVLNVETNIYDSTGIEVQEIDFYKTGQYTILYTAKPNNGVSQTVKRTVEIYDDEAPVLFVPNQITFVVRTDNCDITETLLNEKGLLTNDGNNKISPKIIIENYENKLCIVNEAGFEIKVNSVDDSNNKSEQKTIKIIVKPTTVEQPQNINVDSVGMINCSTGELKLDTGSTLELNTVVYPLDATDKTIKWTSSDSNIVSVTNGLIKTATFSGEATITVESINGKKAICNIKVEIPTTVAINIPVTQVEIGECESGSITLQKGMSKLLSAKVKPENATNKKTNWSSNNSNVTITTNGEVKGINIGEPIIELKSEDGNKVSTCKIIVNAAPIIVDNTAPLKVDIKTNNTNAGDPYNKNGIWSGGTGKKEIRLLVESKETESKISKFLLLDSKGNVLKEYLPLINNNNTTEIIWAKDINEYVTIKAINTERLQSESSNPIFFKLDNTGPTIIFNSWIENPNSWVKDKEIKVTYKASDNLSEILKYEYTHDDVKAKPLSEINIAGTTNQVEVTFQESNLNKYVYVRAIDKLGNIGPWTQKPSYLNMDSRPPKAPIIDLLNNNTTKVTVGFKFEDSTSPKMSGFGKYEYKLNSDTIKEILVENETFDMTTEGTYRVDAWSFDKAGNKSTPSYKDNIKVLAGETNTSPTPLNKNVDISLNPNNKGKSVPTNFLGFSTESGSLCDLMALYKNNLVMERLFTNLSPAVWRVGGNTLERINWNKSAENCDNTTINSKLIDDMFVFASKINWKIIYGLNLKNNTLTKVKDESKYVLSKYNSSLYSLEIGNEPDLYDDWNYTTYIGKWLEYARGIKSLSYESKIAGPGNLARKENYSDKLIFFENFIKETNKIISSAAIHLYPLNGTTNDPSISDVDYKLSMAWDKSTMVKIKTSLEDFVSKAKHYSLNTRISETNNIAAGGVDGFSNTYAASLWAVDYLFTVLESGIKGVNFHGNFLYMKNTYSPIWSTPDKIPFATPNYYALLLFKQAANNGYSIPLNIDTSLNVIAHAIENNNKKLQLVIINKEATRRAVVRVNTNTNYKSASAIRLTAPSLSTKITSPTNSQVKLGGKSVNADGSWNPDTPETISLTNEYATISVPPISAILVTFEP